MTKVVRVPWKYTLIFLHEEGKETALALDRRSENAYVTAQPQSIIWIKQKYKNNLYTVNLKNIANFLLREKGPT